MYNTKEFQQTPNNDRSHNQIPRREILDKHRRKQWGLLSFLCARITSPVPYINRAETKRGSTNRSRNPCVPLIGNKTTTRDADEHASWVLGEEEGTCPDGLVDRHG
jgi:hypothetical protein